MNNHKSRTWRHEPITVRQRIILIQLAAGWDRQKIRTVHSLRPTQLDEEVNALLVAYNANNVRMLITLAYLDDEISLLDTLPLVIAEMNGPRAAGSNLND